MADFPAVFLWPLVRHVCLRPPCEPAGIFFFGAELTVLLCFAAAATSCSINDHEHDNIL